VKLAEGVIGIGRVGGDTLNECIRRGKIAILKSALGSVIALYRKIRVNGVLVASLYFTKAKRNDSFVRVQIEGIQILVLVQDIIHTNDGIYLMIQHVQPAEKWKNYYICQKSQFTQEILQFIPANSIISRLVCITVGSRDYLREQIKER
jgi:hypothetical protein